MTKLLVAALLLAAATLAGCAGNDDATLEAPELTWPVMDITTTAAEPFEEVGLVRVAWSDGVFAIESAKESDLARGTVVTDTHVYSTYGQRWTQTPLSAALALGNRPVLWDLRSVVSAPGMHLMGREDGPDGATTYHWSGVYERGGEGLDVDVRITATGRDIASAHLASPAGRESPIDFRTTHDALGFPAAVPAQWKTRAEVAEKDVGVQDGHRSIVLLLKDYQTRHGGTLPETVDPDSLAAELLVSAAPWPQNPYDDAPMKAGTGPGDYSWTRCTLSSGLLVGQRWDGESAREPFGARCDPAFA